MYKKKSYNRSFKKKPYKRRYYKKTYNNKKTYAIAKKAANKVINSRLEKKYTFSEFFTSVSNTASIFRITYPGQGVGEGQRVGDDIWLKSFLFSYEWEAADSSNLCRIIIFQWLGDSSIDTPTPADVLIGGGGSYPVYAVYNQTQSQKFRVLYDKTVALSANGQRNYFTRVNIKNMPVKKLHFTNTSGGILDNIYNGQLYVIGMTDSSAVTHPELTYSMRLNYTDA